jgi:hypothetical protein
MNNRIFNVLQHEKAFLLLIHPIKNWILFFRQRREIKGTVEEMEFKPISGWTKAKQAEKYNYFDFSSAKH